MGWAGLGWAGRCPRQSSSSPSSPPPLLTEAFLAAAARRANAGDVQHLVRPSLPLRCPVSPFRWAKPSTQNPTVPPAPSLPSFASAALRRRFPSSPHTQAPRRRFPFSPPPAPHRAAASPPLLLELAAAVNFSWRSASSTAAGGTCASEDSWTSRQQSQVLGSWTSRQQSQVLGSRGFPLALRGRDGDPLEQAFPGKGQFFSRWG